MLGPPVTSEVLGLKAHTTTPCLASVVKKMIFTLSFGTPCPEGPHPTPVSHHKEQKAPVDLGCGKLESWSFQDSGQMAHS